MLFSVGTCYIDFFLFSETYDNNFPFLKLNSDNSIFFTISKYVFFLIFSLNLLYTVFFCRHRRRWGIGTRQSSEEEIERNVI